MTDRPVGELLDSFGVVAELDDDDLVSDAVVLLKVVSTDGQVALTIACTPSLDWISQAGMLHAAIDAGRASGFQRSEDED